MELFFRGKLLNLDQFRYNNKTVNTLLNYRVLIPKTSYRVTEKTIYLTALIPGESLSILMQVQLLHVCRFCRATDFLNPAEFHFTNRPYFTFK